MASSKWLKSWAEPSESIVIANAVKQSDINDMVQRNVDHIELVLAYEPVDEDDDTPDVAGSSDDKTSYTTAVATGNTYITDNS